MMNRRLWLPVFRMTAFGPAIETTRKGTTFPRVGPVPPMSSCVCDWRAFDAAQKERAA